MTEVRISPVQQQQQAEEGDGAGKAAVLLYLGLGLLSLGLGITFVGLGEKGFKTAELRLLGSPETFNFGGAWLCSAKHRIAQVVHAVTTTALQLTARTDFS